MNKNSYLMRRFILILALLSPIGVLYATESKAEAVLRAKLVAAEASRDAALADKVRLTVNMAALTKARAQTAGTNKTATQDAALARDAQTDTTIIIQQAAIAASTAAMVAQAQAKTFNSNSLAMICVQILVLLGIVGGFMNSAWISARDHRWAMEAAKQTRDAVVETQKVIVTLEKNTNSIKDALVKTTGEKAFAEGLKQGEASTRL